MDSNIAPEGKSKRITRIDPTKLDVDVQNKLKTALARIKASSVLSKVKKLAVLKPHNKVAVVTQKQQQQPQDTVTTSTAAASNSTAMGQYQLPETAAITTPPSHVGLIKPVPLQQMQQRPMGLSHDSEFAIRQPKILDPVKNLIRDRIKLQMEKKSKKEASLQASTSKHDQPQDLISTAEKQRDEPPTVPVFSIELVNEPVIVTMSASEMDVNLSPDSSQTARVDIAHIPIILMPEVEAGRTQLEDHHKPRPTNVEEPINPMKKISILENVEVKGTDYTNLQISQANVSIITPERPKKTNIAAVMACDAMEGNSNLSAGDDGEESFVGFETDTSDMATLKRKCHRFFNKFDSKVNKASLELAKAEEVRVEDKHLRTYSKRSSGSRTMAEESEEMRELLVTKDIFPSVEHSNNKTDREPIVDKLKLSETDETPEDQQPIAQEKERIVLSHPSVIEAKVSSPNKESEKKSNVDKAPMRKMKFKPIIPGRSTREAVPAVKTKLSAVIKTTKTAKALPSDIFKPVSFVETSKEITAAEEGQPNNKEEDSKKNQSFLEINIEDDNASSPVFVADSNAEDQQPVGPSNSEPVVLLEVPNSSTNVVEEDNLKATAVAKEPEPDQDPVITNSQEDCKAEVISAMTKDDIENPNIDSNPCESSPRAPETNTPSKRLRVSRVVAKKYEDKVLRQPSRESQPIEELEKVYLNKNAPKNVSPSKRIQQDISDAEKDTAEIGNFREETTGFSACVKTSSGDSSTALLLSTIPEQVEIVTPKVCEANTLCKRPRVSRSAHKEVVGEKVPEKAAFKDASKSSVSLSVPSRTSNATPVPRSKDKSMMSLLKNTTVLKKLCEQISLSSDVDDSVNHGEGVNNMGESITIPKSLFEKYSRTEKLLKDILMQQNETEVVNANASKAHYPVAGEEQELAVEIEACPEELLTTPVAGSKAEFSADESSSMHDYEDIDERSPITEEMVADELGASADHQSGIEVLKEVVAGRGAVTLDLMANNMNSEEKIGKTAPYNDRNKNQVEAVTDLSNKADEVLKEVVNQTEGWSKSKNLKNEEPTPAIISSRRISIRLAKSQNQESKGTSIKPLISPFKLQSKTRRGAIDERHTTPEAMSQEPVTKSSRKPAKEQEIAQKQEEENKKAEKSTNLKARAPETAAKIPESLAKTSSNTPINQSKRLPKTHRETIDEKWTTPRDPVAKRSRKPPKEDQKEQMAEKSTNLEAKAPEPVTETSSNTTINPPKRLNKTRRETIDIQWTTPEAKSQDPVAKSSEKPSKEQGIAEKQEQKERKAEKSTILKAITPETVAKIPEPVAKTSSTTPKNPPKLLNKSRRQTIDEKWATPEAKSQDPVTKRSRKPSQGPEKALLKEQKEQEMDKPTSVAKISNPVVNIKNKAASRERNLVETAAKDKSKNDDGPAPRSSSRVRKGSWNSGWNIVPSPTNGGKLTMTLKRPISGSIEVSEKANLADNTKKIVIASATCNVVLQRLQPNPMPAESTQTPEMPNMAKVSKKPTTEIVPRSRSSLGKASINKAPLPPKIRPAKSEQSLISMLNVLPPTKKNLKPQEIPVLLLKRSAAISMPMVQVGEPANKKAKLESPAQRLLKGNTPKVPELSQSPAVTPGPPEKSDEGITPKSRPKTSMVATKSFSSSPVTPQPGPPEKRKRLEAVTPKSVSTPIKIKTTMNAKKAAPESSKANKIAPESPAGEAPLVDLEIFLREQSEIVTDNQSLLADDQAEETSPVPSTSAVTLPPSRRATAPTTQVKIHQFFAKVDKGTACAKTATPQFNVCGNCKESVPIKSWSSHANQHYGLAWIEGISDPIDLDDEPLVARLIQRHMNSRRIKLLRCPTCKEIKKSAVGYASHIRYCGLSSKELQAKTAECIYCQKKMKSASMSAHMTYCPVLGGIRKKAAQEVAIVNAQQKEEDLSGASFSGRGRRLRAVTKLTHGDIRYQYKRNTFHARIHQRWVNEAAKGIKLKCFSRVCRFQTNELREIETHHNTCQMAQKNKFGCRMCVHETVLQIEMEEHVRKEHFAQPTEDGDESEEELVDESDASVGAESSQSEGESGVDEDNDYGENEESRDSDENSKKGGSRTRDRRMHAQSRVDDFKFWRELEMTEFSKKHQTFVNENFSEAPLFPQWSPPEDDKLETVANIFEASVENGPKKGVFANIHCGMVIERVAWMPVPPKADPVLALLCKPKSVPYMKMGHKEKRETIVQLWRLDASFHASHVYSVVRPDGPICAMKFCPSGGFEQEKRLALLALTSVNGDVHIVAMPPVRAKYEGMGLRLPPSCTLKAGVDSVGTSIDWDSRKGHNLIVSGFLNGMIAIWRVPGRRKCSLTVDDDGGVFPVKVFQPFSVPVSTLEINMNHFLACAGPTLKIFDMDNAHETMTMTRTVLDVSCAQWVAYTPYIMSGQSRSTDSNGLYLQQVFNLRNDTFRMISTPASFSAVSYSPVLGGIVTGTANGDVWLREMTKPSCFSPFSKPHNRFRRLLSTISAGVVTEVKEKSSDKKKKVENPEAVISIDIVRSPGKFRRWYAVGYENGMVRVTDLPNAD